MSFMVRNFSYQAERVFSIPFLLPLSNTDGASYTYHPVQELRIKKANYALSAELPNPLQLEVTD